MSKSGTENGGKPAPGSVTQAGASVGNRSSFSLEL